MALIGLLGCAPEPVELAVDVVPGGLDVHASAPISAVEVHGPDGLVAAVSRARSRDVFVPLALPRGADLEIRAGGARSHVHVPSIGVFASLSLPAGSPPVPLRDGDAVRAVGAGEGLLRLVADGAAEVELDGRVVRLGPRGSATAVPVAAAGALRLAPDLAFSWSSAPLERDAVRIVDLSFPVDDAGAPDRTRAPGVLPLPWRPRDGPTTHVAVVVENRSALEVLAEVRAEPRAPGFAPRVPGRDLPYASGVVRLRAGSSARAVLPLYVDPRVAAAGEVPIALEVRAAGTGELLAQADRQLVAVAPGRTLGWFLTTVPLSVGGLAALALGSRRFLAATDVATLALVAALGAVTFVVGAAFQLVGYGVAVFLGPFAPFLTSLFDDLFRVVLLAALVFRAPRVGVLSAATVVGFLMRGLALGSFHPADFLYLGNQVALGEGFLWLSGLTRHRRWTSESRALRTLRAVIAFCPPQAIGVALGLLATSALYRLWWSPAYAIAMIALPGTLYVVIACVLAVPVAGELERTLD